MANLIGVFKSFPKEIFRVNNGPHVHLRQLSPNRRIYDISVRHGMVEAKALQPHSYKGESFGRMGLVEKHEAC